LNFYQKTQATIESIEQYLMRDKTHIN